MVRAKQPYILPTDASAKSGFAEERAAANPTQSEVELPPDAQPLTDAYREILRRRIEAGLQSAREGRVVDGEAVFARIDAELAAMERDGHN